MTNFVQQQRLREEYGEKKPSIHWNTQVTGMSQASGKSTTMLGIDCVPYLEEERGSAAVQDLHGTFAYGAVGYALEMGRKNVLLIDLNREELASFGLFFKSKNPDLTARKKENRYTSRMSIAGIGTGNNESIDSMIQTQEWFYAAMRGWQEQPEDLPPETMLDLLQPNSNGFKHMVPAIQDERLQQKFLSQIAMGRNHYTVVGPVIRRLERLFDEPVIAGMAQPTFDLEQLLREKWLIAIVGGEDEWVSSFVMKLFSVAVTAIVNRNWAQTHQPLYVRKYIDEASKLIGENEATSCGKTLKKGESHCVISQHADYGDELLNKGIADNCFEKYLFHTSSPESVAHNAHYLKHRLDPNLVHHETERTIADGYDVIETISQGESKDDDGFKRVDKRKGTGFRPRHARITDKHYQGLNDQKMLQEVNLMKLGLGECFILRGKELFGPHYIPKLPIPFAFEGMAEDAIEALFQEQLAAGIFRRPSLTQHVWQTPQKKPQQKNGQHKNGKHNGVRNGQQTRRGTRPSSN